MQFQLSTEYAIRILSYLGNKDGELMTADELAKALGITYLYLMKIVRQLRNVNLITSVQGCRGGYRIARRPEQITLYEVVHGIEGDLCICPCLKDGYQIAAKGAEKYSGSAFFRDVQRKMIDILKQTCIADVTRGQRRRPA